MMKPLRMAAVLLLLLLTAWGIFFFSGLDRKTVYATPDNQSAFLKSYTPEPVVDSLRSKRAGSAWANDRMAGAGEEYAHHQREFHGEFEVQGQDLTTLATALSDDVIEQLARCGIRVIGHGGSPQLGFRYSYQAGQTLGEVVIAPVRTRNARSFTGGTPVAIDVYLDEKWFPAKKGAGS